MCFMRCQKWYEVDHCAHHWAVCISVGTVVSAREVSHGGGCERGDPSEKSKMTAARRREARHGGRRAVSERACHKSRNHGEFVMGLSLACLWDIDTSSRIH